MASSTHPEAKKALLLLCNTPDCKAAQQIGESLLDARAAACVNILPECRALYRWQGKVARGSETPLLIKTTAAQFERACGIITRHHPYEVPEIIALDIAAGLPAYLQWVADECAS